MELAKHIIYAIVFLLIITIILSWVCDDNYLYDAIKYPSSISLFGNKQFSKAFLKKAKQVHESNNKYNVRKTEIYNLAKKRSIETGKKLMVIGDPMNGSHLNRTYNYPVYGPPYGYGDLCIDLSGCPENRGKSIKSKLEKVINAFDTDSYVIYISQTIEYLDPSVLEYTLKHLIRVSGGDLFIVHMNYDNDTYEDRNGTFTSNSIFYKVPPYNNIIEYCYSSNKNIIYTIDLNNCDPSDIDSIIITSRIK